MSSPETQIEATRIELANRLLNIHHHRLLCYYFRRQKKRGPFINSNCLSLSLRAVRVNSVATREASGLEWQNTKLDNKRMNPSHPADPINVMLTVAG